MPTKTRTAAPKATAIKLPALKAGEHYAGIIVTDGKPAQHLILLPGATNDVTFKAAGTWAKKQGGELPTRREQSLLFANCKEQFPDGGWHWSSEKPASEPRWAWYQSFSGGYQHCSHVDSALRAVAVRRVPI